jgi:hypothetical protein
MRCRPPPAVMRIVDGSRDWNGVTETMRSFAGRYWRAGASRKVRGGREVEDNRIIVFTVEFRAILIDHGAIESIKWAGISSAMIGFISSFVYSVEKIN